MVMLHGNASLFPIAARHSNPVPLGKRTYGKFFIVIQMLYWVRCWVTQIFMVNLIMLHMFVWIKEAHGSGVTLCQGILHSTEVYDHLCSMSTYETNIYLDPNIQSWSKHQRGFVLSYNPWQWQNNSISCYWPCRVSSLIHFNWASPQHGMVGTLKCSYTDRFSSNTQRYIRITTRNACTDLYTSWQEIRWRC